MSKKIFDPTETAEERRMRIINQLDEEVVSLRKTIRRLRRINRELEVKLKSRS